jgi:hypothetical protein
MPLMPRGIFGYYRCSCVGLGRLRIPAVHRLRGRMPRHGVRLLSLVVLWSQCVTATGRPMPIPQLGELTRNIPARRPQALTGSQFAESISTLDARQREQAILREILEGNLPSFLKRLVPVELSSRTGDRPLMATIFVMPDYLAIGSDADFLRIPMNLETATAVAARFGFVLPTKKIVDAIYRQSAYHFVPEPLPAGSEMRSTAYYRTHNAMIDQQARNRDIPVGSLVSGDKKDVVITNLLARMPGRIAIYGWHRPDGAPIQPLSTVHGACYADYSHGIRLVSEMALEDGTFRSVRDILQDSVMANALSDEGTIRLVRDGGVPSVGEGRCGRGI